MKIKKPIRLKTPEKLPTEIERANILRPSATLGNKFVKEWQKLTEEMIREADAAIKAEFGKPDMSSGMDAKDDRKGFWDRLFTKLAKRFIEAAPGLAAGMVRQVERSATAGLVQSLKATGVDMTLNMKNNKRVEAAMKERIDYSVGLIRAIPEKFVEELKPIVNHAISEGKGLEDIEPAMLARYGEARRHAKNVALDQTRKAYSGINRAKMRDSGIKKFEWVHTGGSQEPRPHHLKPPSQGGLNGGIFSLDDPPIMDPKTGKRGFPADDYFCRCTMRPIVDFDDLDDDDE